jgi:hypothetical protein
MLVRFTTDGSVTRNGFEASYTCGARGESPACGPPGAANLAEPGEHIMVNGDSITYVQGATDYTNCVWTTSCAEGTLATVTFTDFLSEGGWDFLNVHSAVAGVSNSIGPAVHNGGIDNSGDLGRFSGTEVPGTIEGVGAFQYISDWSYQEPGSGFTASLNCVIADDPCSTPQTVAIGADFGMDAGYDNNLDCFWTASCAAGRPTVTFATFQTEGNFDFVNIYPGEAVSGPTLSRCHGNNCPPTAGEWGSSLTIHFESDGSVSSGGFTGTFACDTSATYDPTDCTFTRNEDSLNMQDAETACTVMGGHLASIHNPTQQAAVQAAGGDGAWIGFHDRHSEAGCTGQANAVGEAGGFIWTDGSPSDFLAWGGGEPNDWQDGAAHCDGTSTVGEDCTHVRGDSLWNDIVCDEERASICAVCGGEDWIATGQGIPGPDSYMKIDGAGSMWDAESLCASYAGHLASLHSTDDVAAVGALGADGAWIGLHDTYAEAGCTGQSNDHTEEGGFVWTDGSATDYLNWAGGEPNDWQDDSAHCDGTSTVGQDCSHVRDDNAWNDAGCGGNRAAICGMNSQWLPTACNGGTTLFGGGEFHKDQGYDDGHDCNWLLSCGEGLAPSVTFSSFQLEANFDYIRMYDGDNTDATQIVSCSGDSCDGGSGTAQNMLVRMTSDGSVTQDGFQAEFTCAVPGAPPMTACGASDNGAADNEAIAGNDGAGQTVACGESFGLTSPPDNKVNCVWVMAQQGTVAFTGFVSEGGWDFLNVHSDAATVVNIWGPAGNNGGVDNSGDLGRFSGAEDLGTIAGVGAVQFITDWSYMEPGTGFSATLTC